MSGDEGKVDVAAFLDGLAAVHRLEHGQFARMLLDEPGDPIKVFATFSGRHFAPDLFLRPARGFHGAVDIGVVGLGNAREFLLVGRIDRDERFPGCRRAKFAIDEQAVFAVDLHRSRFRRGRIKQALAKSQAALVGRDCMGRGVWVNGGERVAFRLHGREK